MSIVGNIGVAAYGIVANLSLFAISIFAGILEEYNLLLATLTARAILMH